jgi:hypothetical protein
MLKTALVISTLFGASVVALAEGTTTSTAPAAPAVANASVATPAAAPADTIWLERLKVTYVAVLDGPPISALDSNYRTDAGTGFRDEGAPLGVRNDISVMYPINKKVTFGPVLRFAFRAVPEGKNALNDPYIKLGTSNILSESGDFTMPAQIRWGFPWSSSSQKKEQVGYAVGRLIPTYAVPNTKFTFNFDAILKANIFKRNTTAPGATGPNDFSMYGSLGGGYQALENVSLNLGYNVGANHEMGQALTTLNNDGTSIQPGLDWDIFKNVTLSPSVYIMTGNRVSSDTTVTELGLTWKLM